MEAIGLLVKLEARQGKEADAEAFLKSAQPLALDEKATLKWYAIKLAPGKFGIFDTFASESGRSAHVTGPQDWALPRIWSASLSLFRFVSISCKWRGKCHYLCQEATA